MFLGVTQLTFSDAYSITIRVGHWQRLMDNKIISSTSTLILLLKLHNKLLGMVIGQIGV